MSRILIVEDDEKLRDELGKFLIKNGYEVTIVENFSNPIKDMLASKSNLILLDINLPVMDGQYLCKEIRKLSNIPIIMLTSKNNEIDELISMNYGADDYVTKPFNIQILLAKINAVLKRVNHVGQNKIDCLDFILNFSLNAIEKEDSILELTKNEFRIIHCLVNNRGNIISRNDLIEHLWDNDSFVDDNTLTVNITRLKKKLKEFGLVDLIETKRGQGYVFK